MQDSNVKIKADLLKQGYAIAAFESLVNFELTCGQLGEVVHRTEIRFQPEKSDFAFGTRPAPFHSDNPTIPWVAWFCKKQDPHVGEMFLLDIRDVLSFMTKDEQQLLTTLSAKLTNRDELYPLLELGGKPHISYMPHLWMAASAEGAALKARNLFHETVLKLRAQQQYISFRLLPGQALFIDNEVMLHARDALTPQSDRFLLRAYIRNR